MGDTAAFVVDDKKPSIKTATLDLDAHTLTIVWDETIEPRSFEPSKFKIRELSSSSGLVVALTDSETDSSVGNTLVIALSITDQNALKAAKMAAGDETSRLQLDAGAITDTARDNNE